MKKFIGILGINRRFAYDNGVYKNTGLCYNEASEKFSSFSNRAKDNQNGSSRLQKDKNGIRAKKTLYPVNKLAAIASPERAEKKPQVAIAEGAISWLKQPKSFQLRSLPK